MIQDRVIKTKKIEWKNLEWFQTDLKSASDEDFNSLRDIINKNGVIRSFK